MMREVLISIKPKWCELIASGKKTVEVRKTKPKLETPFKVYIYCTKDEPLYHSGEKFVCGNEFGNGKVIGEFVCDDIGEFMVFENGSVQYFNYHDLVKTCLTYEELANYIGKNNNGYCWHISNLVIYDEPKKLGEFIPFRRPPVSWCYVEKVIR